MAYSILKEHGPVIFILGAFVGMWTGWLPSPITRNGEGIARIEVALNKAMNSMENEVRASHTSDEKLVRLLQMVCIRLSKSEAQSVECSDWRQK
jgi:hypothetical protein